MIAIHLTAVKTQFVWARTQMRKKLHPMARVQTTYLTARAICSGGAPSSGRAILIGRRGRANRRR